MLYSSSLTSFALLIGVGLLFSLPTEAQPTPASKNYSVTTQLAAEQVNTIIQREMRERRIPGLQVAVVDHGHLAFLKAYGLANLQDSIPVTNQSIFAINSCTKVFTGVAIMQLVEAGKINLSAPISTYLDSLPTAWQPVTVQQLLTHSSGLPDLLKLLDPAVGSLGTFKNEAALWIQLKTMPVDFPPGERFSYNQTNGYLLGKLIDTLSGQPFATLFSDKQFQPAGMTHTVFGDSRDIIPHFAPTYTYRQQVDGQPLAEERLINNYYEFPSFRRTASGLNSTAEDMAKWVTALQHGNLLTARSSLTTLWSPIPFNNGSTTPWALGWGLTKFRPKHRAVGMSGGGRAAFLVYPDDDLAVIVLTNLGGSFPEDFLEEVASCYNPAIAQADAITFLRMKLRAVGFDKAVEVVQTERKQNKEFTPNEFELNEWAYRLMAKNQLNEALAIFKVNVYLFPTSWNAYDSYGEALLKNRQKEEAIAMYRKSIELNPDNKSGKKALEYLLKK